MFLCLVTQIQNKFFQVCTYEYRVQENNLEEGNIAMIHLIWKSFKYKSGGEIFEAENLDYEAVVTYKNLTRSNGQKTVEFQLKLVRKFGRCLIETILPTTLLVLVCSVSIVGLKSYDLFNHVFVSNVALAN